VKLSPTGEYVLLGCSRGNTERAEGDEVGDLEFAGLELFQSAVV
jgi:hypothetical protein